MSITNRLAWRDLVAHRGRSWLIAVLIALPVVASSAGSVWFATQSGTPEQAVGNTLGRAGTRVALGPDANEEQLKLMTRTVDAHAGFGERKGVVPGELGGIPVDIGLITVAADAPIFEGRWLVDGDLGGDNVLLTRALKADLGLDVGDTIELAGADWPIGGTVSEVALSWIGVEGVVVAPAHPLALSGFDTLFLSEALPAAEAKALTAAGLEVLDPQTVRGQVMGGPDGREQTLVGVVVMALAGLVVASVASSAFTISIRQMRRSLALLSATGAAPKVLFRILVRSGLFLGLLGAGLGALVGAAAGAGAAWVQDLGDPVPGFGIVLRWEALAVFAGMGVVASLAAVWLPARGVAGQDALAALGEAETAMPVPRAPWSALVPLLLGATALGLSLWRAWLGVPRNDGSELRWVVTGSAVATVLWFVAAVMASPWLVERLSHWIPGRLTAWRLALRDAARVGGRSVALVTASASAVALGAWAWASMTALGNQEIEQYQVQGPVGMVEVNLDQSRGAASFSDGALRVAAVADVVGPSAATLEVSGPRMTFFGDDYTQWTPWPMVDDVNVVVGIIVGGAEELAFMLDGDPSADLLTALESGHVVVFDGDLVRDGMAALHETRFSELVGDTFTHTVPAVLGPEIPGMDVLVPPSVATGLGMEVVPLSIWMDYPGVLTFAEEEEAGRAVRNLGGEYWLSHERGPHSGTLRLVPWLMGGIAALASAVAVVGMVLAVNEGRSTRVSLATIGASTGVLRRVAVAQALVCVALGGWVGVITGALPAALAFGSSTVGTGTLPWWQLGALVLGPVAVVALVTAVVVRPEQGEAVRAD